MRYVVLAALMLLAMLTMTNTWAIQTDSVTQGGTSVVVTTTDTAMLTLEPGSALKSNAAGTAYLQDGKLMLDFSRPGKPTDNCHIETFNGSFRDECLNLHWFETLDEAKAIIEAWRRDYNESRPHSTLNDLSPAEFLRQAGLASPALV